MSAEEKVIKKEFNFADTESIQIFLEEQRRNGFQICNVKGDNYFFDKCKREEYLYYVTYRDHEKEKHAEYIKRFESAGWKLCFHKNKEWYYFEKSKTESFTENQRENEVDKKAVKKGIRGKLVYYFVFATVFTIAINICDLSSLSRPETVELMVNVAYILFLIVFSFCTIKIAGRMNRHK